MRVSDGASRRRCGKRRGALAVAGVGVATAVVFGTGATSASWSDAEYATAALTTKLVPAPGPVVCSGGGTFVLGAAVPDVKYDWTAATIAGPNSTDIAGYTWRLTGPNFNKGGTTEPGVHTATIPGSFAPAGTYTFHVATRSATGWTSTEHTSTYRKSDAILFLLLGVSSC
jgi:hypothetical protein